MPTLLIAYDGSPSARTALERATELFRDADAVVVTVALGLGELDDAASSARVALSDDVIKSATARLREAALADANETASEGARIAAERGLTAREQVVATDGALWAALADAAREAGADAIVCGTHGHGAAARAILGSASSGLVHHAGMPVLVVPEEAAATDGPLVIGYDESEPAQRAIDACGRLFGGRPALVVRVWRSLIRRTLTGRAMQHAPLPEIRETVDEFDAMFQGWASESAEEGAGRARERRIDAEPRVVESDRPAATALLDVAREADAAAIAVGRRGRGAVASALLGSVSLAVLHAADRPVLIA